MCIGGKNIKKNKNKFIPGGLQARNKLITFEMNRNQERIKLTEFIKTPLRGKGFIKEQ